MNKYAGIMGRDYKVQDDTLAAHVKPNMKFADIGANEGDQVILAGNMADNSEILAVEPDKSMISILENLKIPSGNIKVYCEGAREFLLRTDLPALDLIFCGATLHEINKTNPELGPEEVVKQFLIGCISHLAVGGKIIISDRYYASSATQAEVEASMADQFAAIGHADERWTFISSALLRKVAEELGLRLAEEHEHISPGVALRYFYVQVYEKIG